MQINYFNFYALKLYRMCMYIRYTHGMLNILDPNNNMYSVDSAFKSFSALAAPSAPNVNQVWQLQRGRVFLEWEQPLSTDVVDCYTVNFSISFLGCETAINDTRSYSLSGTEASFTTEPLEAFSSVQIIIAATNAAGTNSTRTDPFQTPPKGTKACKHYVSVPFPP